MNQQEFLTHHQRTLLLWESMGRRVEEQVAVEAERRSRARFLMDGAVCKMTTKDEGREHAMKVTVSDVNANGACVFGPRALHVDGRVTIFPPSGAPTALEPVVARVVSCCKSRRRYRIGVEFVAA